MIVSKATNSFSLVREFTSRKVAQVDKTQGRIKRERERARGEWKEEECKANSYERLR
jgi:hypothetical protein